MNTPKVSIIVPCFGVEKFLDRCVDSLVNQALKEIEIILVDDGSPDNVPEMCETWAAKDSRIKVIHKENGGLGYARNSGLEVSIGEYVAFVDSDDYVDVEMYQSLYSEAERRAADVVYCNLYQDLNDGCIIKCREIKEYTIFEGEQTKGFLLDMVAAPLGSPKERLVQMSVWHGIYKREIIEQNNILFHSEREIISEDIPFQVDFLTHVKKIVYVPECFYHYCFNENSLTATYNPKRFAGYIKLHELLVSQLDDIQGGYNRANKLFVGYVRHDIKKLYKNKVPNTDAIVSDILREPVWETIYEQLPASSYKLANRIIYISLCKGYVHIIKYIMLLYNFLKKQ